MTTNPMRKAVKSVLLTIVIGTTLTIGFLSAGCIKTDDQAKTQHARLIPLSGQANFRDLGGYKTVDGHTVKWGVLYRSGVLHKLGNDDIESIRTLGVQTVVNFLIPEEMEAQGGRDRLPAGVREVSQPISGGIAGDLTVVVVEARKTGDFSEVPVELNPEIHRLLIEDGAPQYAALIREVLNSESLPLVFHCSHGVHRTGTAAAIVLSLVGVPWDTVREDYLLSNTAREEEVNKRLAQLRDLAAKNQGVRPEQVDTTNMKAFYILDGSYIDAALDEITKQYGSVEEYAQQRLGLNSEEIDQLREVLLE